jgi:putative aminopeptidase FrvX
LLKIRRSSPTGLYIVNAVQEEIGLRGAEMIARRIKPDIAIITDVTHDTTTPMVNKIIEGDVACGKGPSLAYGPAVHNKLLTLVQETAEKHKDSRAASCSKQKHRNRYGIIRLRK